MAGIDKQRWARLSPLLDELLDADEPARIVRLSQLRATDADIADELAELLAQQADVETADFLEGVAMPLPEADTLAGMTVGSYTLERPIGQGGMGSVWLARRSDGRYEGSAAIKFLNLALLGHGGAERFRREGSVLARLEHPNVARLIDAGVAAGSQPYLVLEYVDGEPIDRWCTGRQLGVEARLRLFCDVLGAVAHAHSKLVLHRDLKPSNILVTAAGQVKLLDFGIARLLEADESRTALTRHVGNPFTPEYAAPEQIAGAELSTAADVYALGVILFELLTGKRPRAAARGSPSTLTAAFIDLDVPLASSQVTDGALKARLHGDLDAIINRALKYRPEERYGTVAELLDDIQRFLEGAPVRAQPDSLTYRLGKFVRRHRAAVATGSALALAILIGGGVSLWLAREATLQRDRAFALAARNEAVVNFVNEMLTEIAPTDRPIEVSDLLDRSLSVLTLEGGIAEHKAGIIGLLANYFVATGNPAKAAPLLDRALDLTKGSADVALRGTLLCERADAALLLGKHAESERMIEEGLTLTRGDPLAAARCMQKRASIALNSNDPQLALDYALRAQAALKRSPVPRPEMEATLFADIAAAHYMTGRSLDADKYFADSLAKYEELGRGESPATIAVRNNWAVAHEATGDYSGALRLYDEALRISMQRAAGGEPPTYLLANRAQVLTMLGRHADALAADEQALESATRNGHALGRVKTLLNRAATYFDMGDLAQAERELAAATQEASTAVKPDSPQAMSIRYWRARIAFARGSALEARDELSEIIAYFDERQLHGWTLSRSLRARAEVNLALGDKAAALTDIDRALQLSRAVQAGRPYSALTGRTLAVAARIHAERGAAADSRAAAAESVTHLNATLGAQHPETVAINRLVR